MASRLPGLIDAWKERAGIIPQWLDSLLLATNGQWDPVLQSIVNALVFALAVGIIVSAVLRGMRSNLPVIFALGAMLYFSFFSFWEFTPPGAHLPWYLVLLFSAWHILFTAGRRPGEWQGKLSQLAGLGALFSGPTGFLSAAVVLAWVGFRIFRLREKANDCRGLMAWNTGLMCTGIWLLLDRPGEIANAVNANVAGGNPAGGGWFVGVPILLFLVQSWRTPPANAGSRLLAAFSALILSQGAAVAFLDGLGPVPRELVAMAVLTSVLCLFVLLARRGLAVRFLASTAWGALLLNGLWLQTATSQADAYWSQAEANEVRETALRRYVVSGDTGELQRALAGSEQETRRASAMLDAPTVRAILPVAIRAPIELLPSGGSRLVDLPMVKGRGEGLPAWSSAGVARDGAEQAGFQSEPMQATLPWLQFQVAGVLASTSGLKLLAADGREITPLQTSVRSPDRWKRVNFRNPREPFRVVAHVENGAEWFAFTAPVEAGMASWLGGKFTGVGGWLFGGGIVLGLAGLAGGLLARQAAAPAAGHVSVLAGEVPRLLPWMGLVVYLVIGSSHLDVYAGGADSAGYLNLARLMGSGAVTTPIRPIPGISLAEIGAQAYVPNCFMLVGEARMAPMYPSGLPLLFVIAGQLSSLERAVPWVILAHLAAGVWLSFRLGRVAGLPVAWAWFGAMMIALCPVYLFMGLQPMSDVPSLVWVTAAVLCAWGSRERPALAFVTGLTVALAVLVRPSNLLCLLPVAIGLGCSWRRFSLCILGGLPGAAWQAWFGHHVYGGAFRTGYGTIDHLLDVKWFWPTMAHYAGWLPLVLSPLVVLVLGVPFLRQPGSRWRLVLGLWAGIYLGFYSFYFFTHEAWWYLRFLLPAMPALVVLALLVLRQLAARCGVILLDWNQSSRQRWGTVVLVVVLGGWLLVQDHRLLALYSGRQNSVYLESARWLEKNVPGNAVIFSDYGGGALFYYTSLVVMRCDLASADYERFVDRARRESLPVYALAYDFEGEIFRRVPGAWRQVGSFRNTTLWQWAAAD